jgi:predicted nucleotidyltransferase
VTAILPHHRRFIDEVAERFEADRAVEALLVGGSVAHGLARPDSDLDVMLVVADEELVRRTASHQVTFTDLDAGGYEGGYLDGKYISRGFLAEVIERGSEPARWAFTDAIVRFSRAPDIEELVRSAGAYPEAERDEKLRNFLGHAVLLNWFHREAAKRDDRYLAAYASSRLALYTGRAILAHNRMLYPFHKWFTTMLERAPLRPPDLLDQIRGLLDEPTAARAEALTAAVSEAVGIELTIEEAASRFTEQTEWSWRHGRPPLDES